MEAECMLARAGESKGGGEGVRRAVAVFPTCHGGHPETLK